MKILGWSRGKDRMGDETGLWHLIVGDDDGTRASPVCGKTTRVSGQVEKRTGHACGRCRISALRLMGQPAIDQYKIGSCSDLMRKR